MPNIAIISPRISDSARALQSSLQESLGSSYPINCRRVDYRGTYSRRQASTVINWGSSSSEFLSATGTFLTRSGQVLNATSAVNRAANKLQAFRHWNTSPVPNLEYTTNRQTAHQWLANGETDRVYCRTTLRGNSGDGIVVARGIRDVVQAPLYTKGVDTHHEYRFHVIDGVVFDGVRKAFRSDVPREERNRDVMNHAAGTIFVRSGNALERASQYTQLLSDVVQAVTTLGLDFGAVDVIVDREGNHHIVEVNTACGLEGTTLERYTRAFTEKIQGNPITPWSLREFTGEPEAPESQEILNQTQQESRMNINEAQVGITVTFNPTSGNITSLTQGNTYDITRVGNLVIYVRNNRGRIQGYNPRHFTSGPGAVAPLELVGCPDGTLDTTTPYTSPLRVVLLEDGTSVNVTGSAEFSGTSRMIDTGDTVTIVDMLRGVESGDIFLGVLIEDQIHRYISTSFSTGEVCVDGIEGATTAPVGPQARDIDDRAIREGDYIQVRSGAGGHDLAVGTLGQVTIITDTRISITVEGTNGAVRIQPNRVGKITRQVHERLLAEAVAIQEQTTTSFTVGSNSYRVASRDMDELHLVLRRFTV